MCGSTDKVRVPRQSTGTSDIKVAQAIRAKAIAHSQDEVVHGPRLADCIRRYLDSRDDISPETKSQYSLVLRRLEKFASDRVIHFIRELTVDALEDFKGEGLASLAVTTRVTVVSKLRFFLREAYRRGWILEPLVEKIRPVRAPWQPGEPFTEAQVAAILEGALKLNYGRFGFAKHPQAFRLLLELMLETGLRISDAVRFDPAALRLGEHSWVYTFRPKKHRRTEQPKILECYISPRLKEAIDASWRETGWQLPFRYSTRAESVEARKRMQTIGRRCGIDDCRPHRLRDTFAVNMLLQGVSLEDVSRLLGHSSVKITEIHYAQWTTARKSRLESIVAQTRLNSGNGALGNR
jgi:integrase